MRWFPRCLAMPLAAISLGLAMSPAALAAEKNPIVKPRPFVAGDETVELFEGLKTGQLEAQLIPKDSTQARVLVTNKTKKPLNVKLPEAFGGVPVLAQLGGGGGLQGYGPGGGTIGQGIGGGGLGGAGGGLGGAGGGMGVFNIPAEKVGEFKGECVCLEHGKAEPRPNMKYQLKRIEEVSSNPAVHELCKMLGTGQMSQVAAQAAAWHLNNNMTWQQLAEKYVERADGERLWYFGDEELAAAERIVAEVQRRAEAAARQRPTASPGESASAN